uniref:Uncharacterized protein n=1 Tax=Abalone asfa-like virus TaxID=2839893 RepID=A0A5K7XX86_9VIRU|nr:hypothetical protein [Abalone asfa-like virus]
MFRHTFIDKPVLSPDSPPVSPDSSEGYNITTTFATYIEELVKKIRATNTLYAPLRIATPVKVFLNQMVIDFIKRIAKISGIIIHDIQNGKTLTPKHIEQIFLVLLSEFGDTPFKRSLTAEIEKKLENYKEVLVQDVKPKKEVVLTPEEQVALIKKAREQHAKAMFAAKTKVTNAMQKLTELEKQIPV